MSHANMIHTNNSRYHLHPITSNSQTPVICFRFQSTIITFQPNLQSQNFRTAHNIDEMLRRCRRTHSPAWLETFYSSQVEPWNIWAVHPAAMATGIFYRGTGLWLDAFHFAFTNQRLGFGPIRLSLLCRVVIMQWEGMRCRAWWAGIPSPKLHTDTNYMYRRQPC